MKLARHYYSIVSGLAASLGSFFGKMITYSASEMVNVVATAARRCFMFRCERCTCDAMMPYYIFFPFRVVWCWNEIRAEIFAFKRV